MSIRSEVYYVLALAGTCASLAVIPGCSNPPTPAQIEAQVDEGIAKINAVHATMIRDCRSQYSEGSAERTACMQAADEWRQTTMSELFAVRNHAYQENWRAARDSRKRLEEKLQDMLPTWPQIQDLINVLENTILNATGTPTGIAVAMDDFTSVDEGEPPMPVVLQTYSFNGQLSFEWANTPVSAPFGGTLILSGNRNGSSYSGVVRSGTLVATFPGGVNARFTVVNNSSNTVQTDALGMGSLTFLADFEHDLESWDSILFSQYRISVPISMDNQGVITIDATQSDIESMLPYVPKPYTDYDLSDTYVFLSDFAAFISDFALQRPGTDINYDGVWDQSDVDQWIADFLQDQANMNL